MNKLLTLFWVICCFYAKTSAQDYTQPYRPQFHFSPVENWINDPCGMVFHNGKYYVPV
jgi:fructan beta-fructosidase